MAPPSIETSTREVPLAPELREERQAYVRERTLYYRLDEGAIAFGRKYTK